MGKACQKTKNYGGIPSCMGLVFGAGSNIGKCIDKSWNKMIGSKYKTKLKQNTFLVIPGASKNVILESVLWNQGLLWLGLKLGQLH